MRDPDFVAAFEECSLPPAEFSHRAHVRLAWIYLREHSLLEALNRFSTGVKRYAASLGASAKYHETITWAYMFLIHERMQQRPAATFEVFAAANEDLFGAILGRYYSPTLLNSDLARASFVMPDASASDI